MDSIKINIKKTDEDLFMQSKWWGNPDMPINFEVPDDLTFICQIRCDEIAGFDDENLLPHLLEATVPASKIVSLAKENETTVGVYTTSLYIQAVIDSMRRRDRQKPIVVQVPVNLRQFFESDTTRNFFGVISIVFRAEQYCIVT